MDCSVKDAPSVGLISLSAIADDPRVRRQGEAFSSAGWRVKGFGLAGATSGRPSWLIDDETPAMDWSRAARDLPEQGNLARVLERGRRDGARLLSLQAARFSPRLAQKSYWMRNSRHAALLGRATGYTPQIWLANDWTALPIAQRLVKEHGGILVYDTHELAAEEFSDRFRWRLLHRPLVVSIEREGLRQAALVTCVSDGIADRLQEIYRLKERPVVVRNTPFFQESLFRPTGERIEVLYHGIVSPGRGLEECIESVSLWRPEYRLTIRGPVEESYRTVLEARMKAAGASDRVIIVPPVPMTELVARANAADIGLFVLPDHSRHNRFVLPNKFFEYTMAGLALCVSDLPEMAVLLTRFDLGRLIGGLSREAIAQQLNGLDRETIDCYKRNALAAARQLSWERESEQLVARCRSLVTGCP